MLKHKNCLDRKHCNIQYIFQATTNVPLDVRLCDSLINLKLHCYPLFYFLAMLCMLVYMYICTYYCSFVSMFYNISYMCRGSYGRLAVELNMSPS